MIDKLLQENRFSFYAPFFRVFICIYLLKDIIIMWQFNDIIYKGNSFAYPNLSPFLETFNINTHLVRENFNVFYSIYILLILLFLLGIGKRITVFFLFICIEITQNLAWITLNGGDNILKFAILYFIFIDSYSKYSITPLKYKSEYSRQIGNLLSNLGGYSLCFHFCLVYLVSALHKINADVWFNGVATYYILGSERFRGTPWNVALVKNGFFVTLTTYGAVIIELFFPFLVWNKRFKFLLLIAAALLHLGIAIFMMLYDFQILFILILGFFITNKEWTIIHQKISHNLYSLKTFFIKESSIKF
ncbi:hypothetical protein [Tenacibaculum amylolyticum]|uniref:hypothetical protein n=1 Tax=Tenacibaculum amylolyticum TaxID=104269 RepID=UPI0038955647